jgi:hypothetical protein
VKLCRSQAQVLIHREKQGDKGEGEETKTKVQSKKTSKFILRQYTRFIYQ